MSVYSDRAIASLICNCYLSVATCTFAQAVQSLRCTSMLLARYATNQQLAPVCSTRGKVSYLSALSVCPVSIHCGCVKQQGSAASMSVWQHVKLPELIRPRDTLAGCGDQRATATTQLRVALYVSRSSHTNDFKISTPVAILPGA